MHVRLTSVLCLLAFVAPLKSNGQTGLSQNSGINSADTWVTANITIQGSGSVTLPSSFYNPETGITSSTLPVATSQNFNLEAGYDTNGGLVVNLYPTAVVNPATSDASLISCIRYAGGQMTVFDQSGNPFPMVMPNSSIPIPSPLAFLGTNPGASVITGLVVPNIQTRATAMNAQVAFSAGNSEATLTPAPASGESAAWSYALSGSNWIAQSFSFSSATASAATTRTVAFSGLNWNDNAANDAVRAGAGVTIAAPPLSPSSGPLPTSLGTLASDAAYTPNIDTVSPANCNTNEYSLGGPQNVVMVHGMNSSSCTWTRMANWLNQDFLFGTEYIPSLPQDSPLAQEGADLVADEPVYPGNGYILLGHSQGGLASRWAAQYFQGTPANPISGVITIDSPNNGGNFAANGLVALGALTGVGAAGYVLEGCVTPFDTPGCFLASAEVVGGAGMIVDMTAIHQTIPDMIPGSGFLSALNASQENFNRAAVIGYTPQRWAVARVLTEWIDGHAWSLSSGQLGPEPCNPEDACGERAVVQATEYFFDAVVIALIVDIIVSWFCPPCAALIPYLVETLFWMDVGDAGWNLLTEFPGDGSSDGIVDGPGQIYMGANAGAVQYPIQSADSHSAALRSTYDHSELDAVLANQFHVPTQASCTFGASPTSLSPSALATSGSFNVLTGGGCQWSAFSNAPWLSISSGINGISNGAIDYAVQANPSTVPRQGAIQVGNGISSTTLGVLQAGICTYTFSPGPNIASPAPGETSSIAVNTQMNCPWTVSTTTSWLSITSNSGGLGTGSFTFTAAPNTANTDRLGLISLMGQTLGATLNVIDGSPVGTPGVATVKLSGSFTTGTSNQCATPPNHGSCPVIWPATGTLSVTVAGTTFSASYPPESGIPTSASLAALLAAQINQPLSPIGASVTTSGTTSTITIESSVNGIDTNYPLTPSYTFVQDCNLFGGQKPPCVFNYPAFTVTSTASQLTGGTN
jgi:pimeloyl-ACP methyl ester carboxylesterase